MSPTCSNCGKAIESSWKLCPYCGSEIGAVGQSTIIKDSVVKEVHQTQQIDNRTAQGANVGGSINIVVGTGQQTSPEFQYEQQVITVLRSGGSLERARTELDELRAKLGLTIQQSGEIENQCCKLHKSESKRTSADITGAPKSLKIKQDTATSNTIPHRQPAKRSLNSSNLRYYSMLDTIQNPTILVLTAIFVVSLGYLLILSPVSWWRWLDIAIIVISICTAALAGWRRYPKEYSKNSRELKDQLTAERNIGE